MKQYNGEKAIISLTSWKARISTVSKTLYSLLTMCPEFHIVLVLSEEEFPKKEAELPNNLMSIVNADLIEILWVYKNYKSLKKIVFTMDKYRDVPVISADDDCLYKCNYAEELYNKWIENKDCVVRYNMYNKSDNWQYTQGPSTIYPNTIYDMVVSPILMSLNSEKINLLQDDTVITEEIRKHNIKIIHCYRGHQFCFVFHDEINPISNNKLNSNFANCYNQH